MKLCLDPASQRQTRVLSPFHVSIHYFHVSIAHFHASIHALSAYIGPDKMPLFLPTWPQIHVSEVLRSALTRGSPSRVSGVLVE